MRRCAAWSSFVSLLIVGEAVCIAGEDGGAPRLSRSAPAPGKPAVHRSPPQSWPMFRGNAHQTGLAGSALPGPLSLRWKLNVGEAVLSTAAIVDGVIYVGIADGHLWAIEMATQRTKWKYSTNNAPITSSPAVVDGTVYFGDDDGFFHAVRVQDGTRRWGPYETLGEVISSPSVFEDRVLFGSYDGHLYCLNTTDGTLAWKFLTEGRVHASPAIARHFTFVAGCDGFLRVIDIHKGQEVRAVEMGAYCIATPAIVDGFAYLGTYGEQVLSVDWQQGRVVWTYAHEEKHLPFFASAAVTDDLAIVGGRDRLIHALERKTGDRRWQFATKGRVESSAVVAGDRVYVGSLDGNLYGLDLASGRKVWQFTTGGGILASPAVADGHLVIGSEDGGLYCFRAGQERSSIRNKEVKRP